MGACQSLCRPQDQAPIVINKQKHHATPAQNLSKQSFPIIKTKSQVIQKYAESTMAEIQVSLYNQQPIHQLSLKSEKGYLKKGTTSMMSEHNKQESGKLKVKDKTEDILTESEPSSLIVIQSFHPHQTRQNRFVDNSDDNEQKQFLQKYSHKFTNFLPSLPKILQNITSNLKSNSNSQSNSNSHLNSKSNSQSSEKQGLSNKAQNRSNGSQKSKLSAQHVQYLLAIVKKAKIDQFQVYRDKRNADIGRSLNLGKSNQSSQSRGSKGILKQHNASNYSHRSFSINHDIKSEKGSKKKVTFALTVNFSRSASNATRPRRRRYYP